MKRIMRVARLAARDAFYHSMGDPTREARSGDRTRCWTRWAIAGVFLFWVLAGAAQAVAPRCQELRDARRTGVVGRLCQVVNAAIPAPTPASSAPSKRGVGSNA